MIITSQQLIALLPLLIIGLTVVVVMLSVAWRRHHGVNATLAIAGLNLALLSLYPASQAAAVDVTLLLRIDYYALFYSGLIIIASLATCTFAYSWLADYTDNRDEFYLLILIACLGGIVLSAANHMAALFIGVELLSLPLLGLAGYTFRQSHSLESALKYMVLSAVASSFLLFGIALVYADSGCLGLINLSHQLENSSQLRPLLLAGVGMMVVGWGFKLSLAPFHLWTPDVYQGVPAPAAVFLSTASKIAIFSVVMRLFSVIPLTESDAVRTVLAIMAFTSILSGNLLAIAQNNIRRLLAFSSVAHLGYLLIVLMAVQQSALAQESAGVYLFSYLLSSLGAFGVVSLVSYSAGSLGTDSLPVYRGLFWYRPVLALVMTVMMLSLAGIPITLGFISKFYIIAISVGAQWWWLTAAVIIGSGIGLYYYLRVVIHLYLRPSASLPQARPDSWAYRVGEIVVSLAAILVLSLGIFPQPLIYLVQKAWMQA